MGNYLFTSESVSNGHPDKIADQISDAILDAALLHDKNSRVACETLVSSGLVVLAGEISTQSRLDYQNIVRDTIREIGYDDPALGFDYRSCGIIQTINSQSPDIAQGVDEGKGLYVEQGAGDQGLMFGFACNETPELMPMPIMLAHQIIRELQMIRKKGDLPYLRPDAKTQITLEYTEDHTPLRVHTVVLSTQHAPDIHRLILVRDMEQLIRSIIPDHLIDHKTIFHVNPTGRFVIGGPVGDCGLTGRKIIVDTYGGRGRHGGGAFSGKDPTKVDRSACYAARYVAKNIVAAGLAKQCEVQLSYAIGLSQPVSIKIDTFGTSTVSEELLCEIVPQVFQLSPKGIITMLNLARPIYKPTASGGHFGRNDPQFSWETTDKVEALLSEVNQRQLALPVG